VLVAVPSCLMTPVLQLLADRQFVMAVIRLLKRLMQSPRASD
jgi:hypothetical protein